MPMSYRSSIYAVAAATALLATPSAAQVIDLGKYPNFKGQWVRTGNPNNWIALAGQPPLTPEYQTIWDGIQADLKAGGPGNWPSTFCIPAGMPAMMSFYDPGEIIVTPGTTYILISHNDDSYRRIYTDCRQWPTDPALTYAGYSIGPSSRSAAATKSRVFHSTAIIRASSRSGSASTRPTPTPFITRSRCPII